VGHCPTFITMIPNTFCPAKWDEIILNLSANYVYSCCKSVPIKITNKEQIIHLLNEERSNLLTGIQDKSCNYCWKNENQGYTSRRQEYLSKFDSSNFDLYKNNQINFKKIEINLGNECNFQCTYCNPKFSSRWETDVLNKPYNIFSDRYFYAVEEKNNNNINDTIKWLKNYNDIEILVILGGEPLQNKNFFKIINAVKSKFLGLTTNLSCKTTKPIDKILSLSSKYDQIEISVSLDSTGKNAEFSRYGMDFNLLLRNIQYLISNAPSNVIIKFNSLMTSLTIRDITATINLIKAFHSQNNKIRWSIAFCYDPKILTLNTLPDQYKENILKQLDELVDISYITGVESLRGAILSSVFNNTLYNQMVYFLKEFSERKNISIPLELKL